MSLTSRTGLTASPLKKITRPRHLLTVQLKAIARPAPFVLKPHAGLFNPYPYGCSLLCNHPTDTESRELLRKIKNCEGNNRNILLRDEIEDIRNGLEAVNHQKRHHIQLPVVESVPEELFRRYTETDSRPLTPTPTLASGGTKNSGSRRCVTPDPYFYGTSQVREKTLLILDLRRSHSQETISWRGSSLMSREAPVEITEEPQPPKVTTKEEVVKEPPAKEEDFITRRGNKRKKKRGSSSKVEPQVSADPETAIGPDSASTSRRPSLAPPIGGNQSEDNKAEETKTGTDAAPCDYKNLDSYLDHEIIKQLRRELNEEVIENEFNCKRRAALEEVFRVLPTKLDSESLLMEKELNSKISTNDLWLSLPRMFTRSSARFELPLDSRELEKISPLDYAAKYIFVTTPRKLLYNCIFNKFKCDYQVNEPRRISADNLQSALDLMMGRPMTEAQAEYIKKLFDWGDCLEYQSFCGICAICERILAPQYCVAMPDRKTDPCHEIETADFNGLSRKIADKKLDPRLLDLLQGIKNS